MSNAPFHTRKRGKKQDPVWIRRTDSVLDGARIPRNRKARRIDAAIRRRTLRGLS